MNNSNCNFLKKCTDKNLPAIECNFGSGNSQIIPEQIKNHNFPEYVYDKYDYDTISFCSNEKTKKTHIDK